MVLLVWVLAIAVFLSDGFDVGTIFMSVLMLAGAVITLFSAVLPSVSVATARGLWVFGSGVMPWRSITEVRVTGMPFTWLDGYAVEIVTARGAVTLFSTATYFAWGARRKQRVLEAAWRKGRGAG
ncbi:MAG: hypothetical protein QM582_01055 [Micropruina sp.]|uniref:hypothetical protein n=1 Tax=Micropruina sp. TaxID=2737536 RepID=UPI0039E436CE